MEKQTDGSSEAKRGAKRRPAKDSRCLPSTATPAKTRSKKQLASVQQKENVPRDIATGKAEKQQNVKKCFQVYGPPNWELRFRYLMHAFASVCVVYELPGLGVLMDNDDYVNTCLYQSRSLSIKAARKAVAGKEQSCLDFPQELAKHLEWLRGNPGKVHDRIKKHKEDEEKKARLSLEPDNLPWGRTANSSLLENAGQKDRKNPIFVQERWHSGGEEQRVIWPEPPFAVDIEVLPIIEDKLIFLNSSNTYQIGEERVEMTSYCAYACIYNILLSLIRDKYSNFARAIVSKASPEPLLQFLCLAMQGSEFLTQEMVFFAMQSIRMVHEFEDGEIKTTYETSHGEAMDFLEFVSGTAVTYCTTCGNWSARRLTYIPTQDLERVAKRKKLIIHKGTCDRKLEDRKRKNKKCGGPTLTQNRPNQDGFIAYRDRCNIDLMTMAEAIKKVGAPLKFSLGTEVHFRLYAVMYGYHVAPKKGDQVETGHTVAMIYPTDSRDPSKIQVIDNEDPTKENYVLPGAPQTHFLNKLGAIVGHVYVRDDPTK